MIDNIVGIDKNGWFAVTVNPERFSILSPALSTLSVSPLIKPLDTPRNRLIEYFGNSDNDQISVWVGTIKGVERDGKYMFLNRVQIAALRDWLSDQLLK